MVKSQVLRLLTRLIRKLRHVLGFERLKNEKVTTDSTITQENHLKRLSINVDFLKCILDDIDAAKRQEDKALQARDAGATHLLYGAFIQDSLELLMTVAIPVD
jgi:hypothetical protein